MRDPQRISFVRHDHGSPTLRSRVLGIAGFLSAICAAASAGESELKPLRPAAELFETYCYDCHAEGTKKGDVALDELLDTASSPDTARKWGKAWKIVRHGFMPPSDADLPTEAERKAITQWIEEAQLGVDRQHPDPGRVTIRRLNRMEYEFTVTDLFGTEITAEENYSSDSAEARLRLRDRLPPDDTAYGFDNIGDFQSMSPALLEKYFDIAEFVVDQVVSVDGPRYPMESINGDALKLERVAENKRTDHTVEFTVPTAGKYRVEIQFSLGGWREFGGAYDFAMKVDDQSLVQEPIEIGGLRTHIHRPELELTAGTHRLQFVTVALPAEQKGGTTHLELRPKMRIVGPLNDDARIFPEAHRRLFTRGEAPTDAAARRDYAREIVGRIANHAFRRPVDADTIERLIAIVLRNEQFEKGVREALCAILTSPRFLFRAELQPQPNDPKSVHAIDEYALASRLSYFLWLSLPDEELTTLAAQGKLRENLRAQLTRMLADPKSARFFEDFPGQWLRTRNVLMTAISRRDAEINHLRGAMKRETEMLFEHIARNDRDLIELVTADYTFVDRELAQYYGLKNYDGSGFQKVHLAPETKRGGILTHGSFLISTSNPNGTSPVKRGVFVLENLLAIEPPPPPANVPPLDDAKLPGAAPKTVRAQLAVHREDKSCAACHAHFDPIGISLENYDIVGAWRDRENGEPITLSEKTVTGETLTGIDDIRKLFASKKDRFYHCVTEKLLTYALGRGLDPSDAVTVDRISAQVTAEGGKFSGLLAAVVESPAFQTRRGDDGSVKEPPRAGLPEPPPPEKRKGRRRMRNNNGEFPFKKPDPEAVEAAPRENAVPIPKPQIP